MELTRRDLLRASAAGVLLLAGPRRRQPTGCRRGSCARCGRPCAGRCPRAAATLATTRARVMFNRRFDDIRPPAVVRVRDAADVRAVVAWANRYDVPLVVALGRPCLQRRLDEPARRGRRRRRPRPVPARRHGGDGRPGLRNLAALRRARPPRRRPRRSGSCPNVAVGGLALGGGMGLAGRALGLTLDRVTRVRRRHRRRRAPPRRRAQRRGPVLGAARRRRQLRARHRDPPAGAPHCAARAWFFASYPAPRPRTCSRVGRPRARRAARAHLDLHAAERARHAFGQYFGSEAALRRLVAPLARIDGAQLSAGQRRASSRSSGAGRAAPTARRRRMRRRTARVVRRVVGLRRRAG